MGQKHSHFQRSDASYTDKIKPEEDPIFKQTVNALKAARTRPDHQEVTFDKLLLKFDTLEDGFDKCHEVFRTAETTRANQFSADKRLPLADARAARRKLGIQLSFEEAQQMFQFSDEQSQSLMVLFIDFVIVVSIIIMHKGPEAVLKEGGDPAVVKMALLSMDAFNHLDRDNNGYLYKEDITSNLRDVDGSPHAPKKAAPVHKEDAISDRWKFMDYNQDGRASFRDFMSSLHAWVMGDKSK